MMGRIDFSRSLLISWEIGSESDLPSNRISDAIPCGRMLSTKLVSVPCGIPRAVTIPARTLLETDETAEGMHFPEHGLTGSNPHA